LTIVLDFNVHTSELISAVKIAGSLGCGDHALMEFTILRDMRQANCKVRTLNFRKVKFQLFKELVGPPGKPPSGTGEQNRAGRSFRMLCMQSKSCQSPGVRDQARKGRDWHG